MDEERVGRAIQERDTGHVDEATRDLEALLGEEKEDRLRAVLLMNLATCYRLKGDLGRTRDALRQADRLLPSRGHERLHFEYLDASADADEGRQKVAIKKLGGLIERLEAPDVGQQDLLADALVQLGTLLVNSEEHATAVTYLRSALPMRSEPDFRQRCDFLLGTCYQHLSDAVAAENHLRSAVNSGTNRMFRTRALYMLGLIYLYGGRFEQAKTCLKEAEQGCERGEMPCGLVWSALAITLERLGNVTEAERYSRLANQQAS